MASDWPNFTTGLLGVIITAAAFILAAVVYHLSYPDHARKLRHSLLLKLLTTTASLLSMMSPGRGSKLRQYAMQRFMEPAQGNTTETDSASEPRLELNVMPPGE